MATAVPNSPMSTLGTPTKAGPLSFLSSWRHGSASPKTVSASQNSLPAATDDGNDTPKTAATHGGSGRFFPSYSSGVRKREIIKEQQGHMELLSMQVQQQGHELKRLGQQLEGERAARVDFHERLNMQYLKSNLLVDMLVLRLLDTSTTLSSGVPAAEQRTAPTAVPTMQQQHQPIVVAASNGQQQPRSEQQPQQQATHPGNAAAKVAAKVAAAVAHDDSWDVSSIEDA